MVQIDGNKESILEGQGDFEANFGVNNAAFLVLGGSLETDFMHNIV